MTIIISEDPKVPKKYDTKETFSLFFYCFWQITSIFLNRTFPKPESSVPQPASLSSTGPSTDKLPFFTNRTKFVVRQSKKPIPGFEFYCFFHNFARLKYHNYARAYPSPAGTGSREAYPEGKKTPAFPSGFPH